MSGEPQSGTWMPLVEYAFERGISLSTLRRHIKSNKIRHRKENGRYLIFTEPKRDDSAALQSRVTRLELDLQKAREQIVELKTLIAFYEEGTSHGAAD